MLGLKLPLIVLFKSVLDAKRQGPLHLVIDDSHHCNSVSKLIDMLMAVLNNEEAPTKLKIALFYNSQTEAGCEIERAMRKHDNKYCMDGPKLTSDTLTSLATNMSKEAINSIPYLSGLKMQLSVAVENCSHAVEMLFLIQSLETSSASSDPRTLRSLELLISDYRPSASDIDLSVFHNLSDWGRKALGWITHAKRPLTLDKLEIAVAITDKGATFSSTFDLKDLPIDLTTDIHSQFGPLVMLGEGEVIFRDRTVKALFAHLIDAERDAEPIPDEPFPEKEASSKIPNDAEITDILLSYLSWQEFVTPVEKALQEDKGEFTLPYRHLRWANGLLEVKVSGGPLRSRILPGSRGRRVFHAALPRTVCPQAVSPGQRTSAISCGTDGALYANGNITHTAPRRVLCRRAQDHQQTVYPTRRVEYQQSYEYRFATLPRQVIFTYPSLPAHAYVQGSREVSQ
ncbi:hypothetical protein HDV57DRAFT_366403 [Trichoderma longibrachiatum]